jgi:hypothetical protein
MTAYGATICADCSSPVRYVDMALGYVGPGRSRLLYHYLKLLEADGRAQTGRDPQVRMCDSCRRGEIVYRGDPASPGAGRDRPSQ